MQVADRVVVHKQDVLLRERLLADITLERSVGIEVFVQGVVEAQIALSRKGSDGCRRIFRLLPFTTWRAKTCGEEREKETPLNEKALSLVEYRGLGCVIPQLNLINQLAFLRRLRRLATSCCRRPSHERLQPLQPLRVDRVRRHGVALHGLLPLEVLLAQRAADRRVLALLGCEVRSERVSYGIGLL